MGGGNNMVLNRADALSHRVLCHEPKVEPCLQNRSNPCILVLRLPRATLKGATVQPQAYNLEPLDSDRPIKMLWHGSLS